MAVLLTLPLFGSPVLAETDNNNNNVVPDEAYTIEYESDLDLGKYYENPVVLLVKDGRLFIQMTGSGADFVDSLTINDEEVTWGEITKDETYTFQFEVDSLSDVQDFSMYLSTPRGEMDHHAKLSFDESTKESVDVNSYKLLSYKNVEETEQDEDSGTGVTEPESEEETGDTEESELEEGNKSGDGTESDVQSGDKEELESEEPKNEDDSLIPDEAYTIEYVSDLNLSPHYENPVVLLVKDGRLFIQMTGGGAQFVESLMINDEEVTWGEITKDGTYTIQFEIDSLSEAQKFSMYLSTPMGEMDHHAELSFDENTKKSVDVNDYRLLPYEFNEEPVGNGKTPGPVGKTPSVADTDSGDNKDEKSKKQHEKENLLKPDKTYEIDYIVKHEIKDEPSAADSFFVKPGILLEKSSEYYFQFRLNGKQYVNSIKNKFGELVVVYEGNDYVIYQLKVDGKLTDPIFIDFLLTVPGVYDNQEHTARIFLDPSSMKEVDASQYQLVPSTNNNGPDAPGAQNPDRKSNLDPNTPEKPVLGDDSDSGDDKTTAGKTDDNNLNPDTGEETNVLLYVLLLIGSAIPLAIKAKRRFA